MFNNKKKKAFTLTELLIVVIIIGVLAAVVLPKFNKVMETRKTTEAEEMMAAVRTEQEYRCAMDKPYLGDIDKLTSLESQNRVGGLQVVTKNYTYELEPSGILARSASKEYNLKMPSYADGRVCCEGNDCSSLNKDYPLCSELTTRSDFQVATECTAGSAPAGKACVGVPQKTRICPEGCGKQSRTATCNAETGEWEYSAWSPACEERLPDVTEDCACGHRTKTAQCNTSTGQWEYGDWDKTCTDPETETASCADDDNTMKGEKTRTQICNEELGEWTYEGAEWIDACVCDIPAVRQQKETCGCTGKGEKVLNFNEQTCAWETEWSECTEKEIGCCAEEQRIACTSTIEETLTNYSGGRGNKSVTVRYSGNWEEETCTCSETCVYADGKAMDLMGTDAYRNMTSTISNDNVLHCRGTGCSHSSSDLTAAVDRLYNQCVQTLSNQCSALGISVGQTGTKDSPKCYVCEKIIEQHCFVTTGGGRGNSVEVPCDTSEYTTSTNEYGVQINTRVCGLIQ